MANPISQYMTEDAYNPVFFNPSLQQYDNYGIYDLHCVDIGTDFNTSNGYHNRSLKERVSFLAVQAYSPNLIACDFNSIINTYP